jgi:mannose-6-phosphate isomerase
VRRLTVPTVDAGPLLLKPKLDPKPWGGRRLEQFGFDLPKDQRIGEALITSSEAVVLNGPRAGSSLGDLLAEDPAWWIGARGLIATRGLPLFPILIKLIDASEHLSIQVHPSDATAPSGSLGKTEAWHVLDAAPNSVLYVGLQQGARLDDLEAAARAGQSTAHFMRSLPARPGMTIFIPAGTVHALGAGVLIYEIQQPSGITYRLDDWGRVDASGQSRELHIDQGIPVIDIDLRPEPQLPLDLPAGEAVRSLLVRCPLFTAERIALGAGGDIDLDGAGAPHVLTLLSGELDITANGKTVKLRPGQTAAMLAESSPAVLTAPRESVVLRGWLDPSA